MSSFNYKRSVRSSGNNESPLRKYRRSGALSILVLALTADCGDAEPGAEQTRHAVSEPGSARGRSTTGDEQTQAIQPGVLLDRKKSTDPSAPDAVLDALRPGCINYGISTRPLLLDEHWTDPANPASGEHVVLYFRVPDSVNPDCLIRKWQGYERDWLDGYMLWAQPIGAGDQRIMLFISGWWWWPRRALYTANKIALEFELVW